MRSGGGHSKGAAFEREVSVTLSLWVSHGKNRDLFWRTSMSGGRATVARKSGRSIRQSGDICSITPEGHAFTDLFYVECKHYQKLDLETSFIKGTGKLARFWSKAIKEAKHYRRDPMLIAKQNNMPTIVVTAYPPKNFLLFSSRLLCHVSLFSEFVKTEKLRIRPIQKPGPSARPMENMATMTEQSYLT